MQANGRVYSAAALKRFAREANRRGKKLKLSVFASPSSQEVVGRVNKVWARKGILKGKIVLADGTKLTARIA